MQLADEPRCDHRAIRPEDADDHLHADLCRIEAKLDRLMPLADLLVAATATDENGDPPSLMGLLKLAMGRGG